MNSSDVSDTAKTAFAVLLACVVIGISVFVANESTDMFYSWYDSSYRVTLSTEMRALIEITDTAEPISGATLYYMLVHYGDSITGITAKSKTVCGDTNSHTYNNSQLTTFLRLLESNGMSKQYSVLRGSPFGSYNASSFFLGIQETNRSVLRGG